MTTSSSNSSDPIPPGELLIAVTSVLVIGGTIALVFRALDWPILFGVTVGLVALFVFIAIGQLFTPTERKPSIHELAEKERFARQLTASIEADTDHRTAELMRQFLDRLPADERALLGLRLMAESRVARTVEELEREVATLRGELAAGGSG